MVGQNGTSRPRCARRARARGRSSRNATPTSPPVRSLETDPAGGAMVREGAVVTVIYSDGPEKIPDVVGMQQAEAEKTHQRRRGSSPTWSSPATRRSRRGRSSSRARRPAGGARGHHGDHRGLVVRGPRPSPTSRRPRRPTATAGLAGRRRSVAVGPLAARLADRLGVVEVEQAVVRRRGDRVSSSRSQPTEMSACSAWVAVDVEVVVVLDRVRSAAWSPTAEITYGWG